jgi:hypothetical protein
MTHLNAAPRFKISSVDHLTSSKSKYQQNRTRTTEPITTTVPTTTTSLLS